jgi:hypothetical protein
MWTRWACHLSVCAQSMSVFCDLVFWETNGFDQAQEYNDLLMLTIHGEGEKDGE